MMTTQRRRRFQHNQKIYKENTTATATMKMKRIFFFHLSTAFVFATHILQQHYFQIALLSRDFNMRHRFILYMDAT